MLCSETNRISIPGSPSTCALDTSITPIPSFLLLAFLATYIPTRLLLARRHASSSSASRYSYDPYTYSAPIESRSRKLSMRDGLPKWIHWTYIALVVCLLGLRVLEVVRLVLAHMGVGLLPVGIVANVVNIGTLAYGGLEMGRTRSLVMSASLALYWALATILESIKVVRLSSYNSLHPAKGTAYPSSDWLLDNGCMLGLFVVFLIMEGAYLVLRWRSSYLALSHPEPIREQSISKPQLMDGYGPVVYPDERTADIVA